VCAHYPAAVWHVGESLHSGERVIEASKIRKDSKVRVHYIKQGDDMLVDRVIVSDRD
jgi:hypothetical protein